MTENVSGIVDLTAKVGSVEEILADAANGIGIEPVKFNTHIHLPPNFSAFETVEQAVELASDENVKVLGAGNYYNFNVYGKFSALTAAKGIYPVFGTEIIALETSLQSDGIRVNDPGNPGKYYICGKAITRFEEPSARARELLGTIGRNDTLRMCEMAAKLAAVFSANGIETGLNDKAVISRVVSRHGGASSDVTLQERHLAQAFQEVFFQMVPPAQRAGVLEAIFGCESKSADDPVSLQNEIRSYLMKAGKSCYVPETFVDLATAKELVGELGGIACYPTLADGAGKRCEYEFPLDKFIETLKNDNYSMVEFIPLRNSPEVLSEYVKAIRKAGIVVVAGTEHNTLDLIPIEPSCLNEQAIPQEVNDIFWEGACVLAAHQFLTASGECGLVDGKNMPNQAYPDSESRIQTLAKIGSAVLKRYYNM